MENKTFNIVTFAILIEAIITYFNESYVQGNICWQMLLSMALGTITVVAYKPEATPHRIQNVKNMV